ncbi:MAG: AraC family transcriptional regulator [Pseudomonadota bacterium]|nr:AraC family transcriptional regulator [Pseudomonadota bacterium]
MGDPLQHLFDRRHIENGMNAFHGLWNHDSYRGDYLIEADPALDVQMHCKTIGACSLIHARSRARQSFRRSWTHIREDATDVVVLCFVTKGGLRLEYPSGEAVAQAGDFVVMKSIAPFLLECGVGNDDAYEAIHLIVPTHMMRHHICLEVAAGFCVSATGRSFKIAERILEDVVDDQGEISEPAARLLVEAALASLSDAIKCHNSGMSQRPSHADMRLRAVMRFIDLHLSDPKLSVRAVAEGCGVSPRYIFSLFQRQETTFSELVWRKRLNMAAQWLSTSTSNDAMVSEIAYRAGFKSAAHFTRMFKRRFKESPRRFRATAQRAVSGNVDTLVIGGGAPLTRRYGSHDVTPR